MSALTVTTNIPCPNMCEYCPQKILIEKYRGNRFMSLDTFCQSIDKLPILDLHFSGFSEPFINPLCVEMIKYAHNLNRFNLCLYSTLNGLTLDLIDELRGISFKTISIHVPDDKMQLKVSEGYIKILNKFLDISKNARTHIIGMKNKTFGHAHFIPIKHLHTRANNLKTELDVESGPYIEGKLRCNSGINPVLVPSGDVYICCMDFGLKHKIGNLLESTYESLFESKEYLRIAEGVDEDILCRYCIDARKV